MNNKNLRLNRLLFAVAICAGLLAAGCAPPGPRALLQGERLIREGRYPEAVARLQEATTLMPKNAQAWNHLGLACHGQRRFDEAQKAYRIALSLDHKLASARFNLGCLYLEQNALPPAVEELTSYTLLQPGVVEGWLKLGSAHLRGRRIDYAEQCFRAALDLQPRHPEALVGLGAAQYQRRRWTDAANFFRQALAQSPNYPPALLNLAVVHHQGLNQRSVALQHYRQYLALQPRPSDADSVAAVVRQVEDELNPASFPLRPITTNFFAQVPPRTNPPPTAAAIRPAPEPAPVVASVRSNVVAAVPVKPPVVTLPTPVTNPVVAVAKPPPAVDLAAAAPKPPPEPPKPPARPVSPPAAIEVAQVTEPIVVRPPRDIVPVAPAIPAPRPAPPPPISAPPPEVDATTSGTQPRRNLLTKLNPFSARGKSDTNGPAATAATQEPKPPRVMVSAAGRDLGLIDMPSSSSARYTYLSPAAPSAGDRAAAQPAFMLGLRAQQTGQRAQAIREYQTAVRLDPAFYDAYYNLGLAALNGGEVPLSLWAYEIALALQPDAVDARYNFALALKAGGYVADAAGQLNRLLRAKPDDARAHLTLADLYARPLGQPDAAREHFRRVLELNPRHPEAPKVREWLASNP